MTISDQHIASFRNEGFSILRGGLRGNELLESIWQEIGRLGRSFNPEFRNDDAESISALAGPDRERFYRALRYLPSLAAFGGSAELLAICRALGIAFPALMRSFNIRMDMPDQDQYLFHWHQDITYLLGSRNSITFWLPLGPADRMHGTIEVVPNSHHAIEPFVANSPEAKSKSAQLSPKDVRLVREPAGAGEMVEVERGDIVVFSQFLLHRSLPNRSQRPRWTIQLRYSDLEEEYFRESGYPFGDMTTIFRTDYLDRHSGNRINSTEKK